MVDKTFPGSGAPDDPNKMNADYAMLYDILSRLALSQDEQEVIHGIIETFEVLCAPAAIAYLPYNGEAPGTLITGVGTVGEKNAVKERLEKLNKEFERDPDGGGFTLQIRHGGQKLGVVMLEGILFPQHLNHYLNLALNAKAVMALAMYNARTIHSLQAAKEELADANRRLQTEIAERKLAEESMREQKELAEMATLQKDKYVSLVSHDLKGPLGVIYGFLPIVRQQLLANGDSHHAGYLDISITATKRMLNMINELLTIGRFKTGKIQLQLRPVDVHALIEEDLEIFTPFARQKGITVSNALPAGFTVCADPDLFGEVLHNLLSNAIKFTPNGGRVTISAPEGKPDTIAVTDTGTGIRPEFQKNLFHYEEKTTHRGTNGEAGTGFGLPLTWDIILAHNGTLHFETETGKGSTFFVHLPEKGCAERPNQGK